MAQLHKVQFLNAGYCSQSSRWTGLKSWKWTRFYAVVVYFEHPVHGPHLIDTGYGEHFWPATRQWPYRIYRWLVPAHIDSNNCIKAGLERGGVNANSINGIFLSHFHPDHIAGVASLPRKPLIVRHETLEGLFQLSPVQQVHHGFVPALLPSDRRSDIVGIAERCFQLSNFPGTSSVTFRLLDYWGDGSLILVDLPGHSPGHTGYFLNSTEGPLLYVVDAAWNIEVMLQQQQLPRLSRGLQSNYQQYWQTQQMLVTLAGITKIPVIACHCPRTQAYVARAD